MRNMYIFKESRGNQKCLGTHSGQVGKKLRAVRRKMVRYGERWTRAFRVYNRDNINEKYKKCEKRMQDLSTRMQDLSTIDGSVESKYGTHRLRVV